MLDLANTNDTIAEGWNEYIVQEKPDSAPRKDTIDGRPKNLLQLACSAVGAALGGVAYLSAEGELIEHVTCGCSEEAAARQRECMRLSAGNVETLFEALAPSFKPPLQRRQFLGVKLATYGSCRGVLYFIREPGDPEFGPADGETARVASSLLEQGAIYEEARLLAQVNMFSRVTQEAAGNPNLSRILKVALRELDRHLPLHVSTVWLAVPEKGDRTPPIAQESWPPFSGRGRTGT